VLAPDSGDRVEVIDLFLGGWLGTLEVGPWRQVTGGEGWISAEGLYVLPQFLRDDDPSRNHIEAWDLDRSKRVWRIDLEQHRGRPHMLRSVIEHRPADGESRRLCVLNQSSQSSDVQTVHVLDERLGALSAPLAELRAGSNPLGLHGPGVSQLDSPLLFVETRPSTPNATISLRAIDLRVGVVWDVALPAQFGSARTTKLLAPAVTRDHVILLGVSARDAGRSPWELVFLDRATGQLRESRPLPKEPVSWYELTPVGSTLFMTGANYLDRME
jgi:hypothetical protein